MFIYKLLYEKECGVEFTMTGYTRRDFLERLTLGGVAAALGCGSEHELDQPVPYNPNPSNNSREGNAASPKGPAELPKEPSPTPAGSEEVPTGSTPGATPVDPQRQKLEDALNQARGRSGLTSEPAEPKPISVYGDVIAVRKYGQTRVHFTVNGDEVKVDTTNTRGKIVGLDEMLTTVSDMCTTTNDNGYSSTIPDKLCIAGYTLDAQVDAEGNASYVSVVPTVKLNDKTYTSRDALERDYKAAKGKNKAVLKAALVEYDRIHGVIELPSDNLTSKYTDNKGSHWLSRSPFNKSAARAVVDGVKSAGRDVTHYLGRGLRSVMGDLFGSR